MSKIFIICPVRNVGEELKKDIDLYVTQLEALGYDVHYPPRDTDQNDSTGLRICRDNRKAIEEADAVHVVWDGESQGSLFDLGMAFAMGKRVVPVGYNFFPNPTRGKSFQSMVWALYEEQQKRNPDY